MKKFFAGSISLIALAAFAMPAAAQEDKAASDQVVVTAGRAERRLDNMPFRMVLTTEWFTAREGERMTRSVETFAMIPDDRYHWITEVNSTRIETITVGRKTFRRTDGSDWESVATSPASKAGANAPAGLFGDLAGGAILPKGVGRFVARGTIDGQEVTMYELKEQLADRIEGGTSRMNTTQYWINNDGLIVRRIIEQDIKGDRRFMRTTANYTYSDIRIEEPILPIRLEEK